MSVPVTEKLTEVRHIWIQSLIYSWHHLLCFGLFSGRPPLLSDIESEKKNVYQLLQLLQLLC